MLKLLLHRDLQEEVYLEQGRVCKLKKLCMVLRNHSEHGLEILKSGFLKFGLQRCQTDH
jgi:hypothetical protein